MNEFDNFFDCFTKLTNVTKVTKLVGTPCDVVSICSIGKDTAEPSSCCPSPQLDANLCGAESDAVASELLADLYDIVVTTHGLRSRESMGAYIVVYYPKLLLRCKSSFPTASSFV